MKKEKKIRTHEGPKERKNHGHMKVQSIEKNDEHMKAHVLKKIKDSHVLKIKFMRDIIHIKEYSIGLTLFYPHTFTS